MNSFRFVFHYINIIFFYKYKFTWNRWILFREKRINRNASKRIDLKCRRYFHKEPKKWKKHILAFFAVQWSNVVEAEPKDQSSQNRRKKDPK